MLSTSIGGIIILSPTYLHLSSWLRTWVDNNQSTCIPSIKTISNESLAELEATIEAKLESTKE